MSNQDWTSKLQDQLADYQESVSHDLWAGIEQSLAHSETGKKARIVYFKRWSAAAAAVALLGIGGSYVYLHQEDVEKGNLQLASLSSPAVSADSHIVSADLQSAASQKKASDVLKEESENEISLLAEKSDHKSLTRSTDNHAAAYASQSYHLKRMRRYLAGRCNSMPKT